MLFLGLWQILQLFQTLECRTAHRFGVAFAPHPHRKTPSVPDFEQSLID
jgi:hypothetical protein